MTLFFNSATVLRTEFEVKESQQMVMELNKLDVSGQDEMELDEEHPFEGILSATAFAVRSTYHTTLQATPGQLVFGRDMILNIGHIASWKAIAERKQKPA